MLKRKLETNGMWVMYEGRVGILEFTGIDRDEERAMKMAGIGTVSLVDANGVNELILHGVPVADLRQAKFTEIPAARRPSKVRGAALGYV